jgi:hypothetical protein
MFDEQDMIALRKILKLPGYTRNAPRNFRSLAEDLFPELHGIATNKYPPALRLRGKLTSKYTLRNLTEFYKKKRMHWPLPSDLSQEELEFLEAVHTAYPQEQLLRRRLTDFFSAGFYNKIT